jgi:hypothetical protein
MHHLSSKWTFFFLCLLLAVLVAHFTAAIIDRSYAPYIAIPCLLVLFILIWVRDVKVIRYDDDFAYVRDLFSSEKVPLTDIRSVHTPTSSYITIYELRLKSGRAIEFIPMFSYPYFWQGSDVPDNVRRFQTILRNFQPKHAS